jgi:hypothetical protein
MIGTPQGDFEPGNSPFAKRPWTWGMTGIGVDVARSGNSTVINNLSGSNVKTESFTNSGPPFAPGSFVQFTGTFVDGVFTGSVNYIGSSAPPPVTTTTTPPPTTTTSSTTTSSTTTSSTTTSSTTTSSTTTSSTTTSSTTTTSTTTTSSTTTTPPPGYAYNGVDCDGNSVTIYTANSTFNNTDTGFADAGLTILFNGYFIYSAISYLYTSGVAAASTCPTTTTTTTSTTTSSTTTTTQPPPTTTTTSSTTTTSPP